MYSLKYPPILRNKDYKHPSIFTPANLLREARRQKSIANKKVPRICLLDPDGDIVSNLCTKKKAVVNPYWACYHTQMYHFQYGEIEYGIHYLPPSDFSLINQDLHDIVTGVLDQSPLPIFRGDTWTTDAPFRETSSAIEHFRSLGILAVEMEAAALYAFSRARDKPVICFAHVTNQMGSVEGDFEKGFDNGSSDCMQLVHIAAKTWMTRNLN